MHYCQSPTITRFMNWWNSGTVKAISPYWGLQIMPFEIS